MIGQDLKAFLGLVQIMCFRPSRYLMIISNISPFFPSKDGINCDKDGVELRTCV